MAPTERDRGPGLGSRASEGSAAAKLTDTATVSRTTWDGHPSLSVVHDRYVRTRRGPEPAAIDAAGVAVLEGGLAELLGTSTPMADVEAVAIVLCDRYGPTWCRRLAGELHQVADDLLAERRTPWGAA